MQLDEEYEEITLGIKMISSNVKDIEWGIKNRIRNKKRLNEV